jgi:hypothetical protein
MARIATRDRRGGHLRAVDDGFKAPAIGGAELSDIPRI